MNTLRHCLVVGAGFSGAVLARELVERIGCTVVLIDQRDHPAGNCHTRRDPSTGILLHEYGPHIFHTDRQDVWDYVRRFGEFGPFINRVKASIDRGVFSLPINLHTINQFFGKRFSPREAEEFLRSLGDRTIGKPRNFEEQALKMIGAELYEAFFRGYTIKQWGCDPTELPASILSRLPVRFNYDDNYYSSPFQGIPVDGYTAVIERILDLPGIEVQLKTSYDPSSRRDFDHVFFTGPIDSFFNFELGRLGYRTVYWERIDAEGDYQGTALINYPGMGVPFTRIHEHKHFAPWESHGATAAFREFSKETGTDDIPYYPKRLAPDKELLARYVALAREESGMTFLGRLGTYRYLDMHKVIGEALDFSARCTGDRADIPTFPEGAVV